MRPADVGPEFSIPICVFQERTLEDLTHRVKSGVEPPHSK